MAVVDASNAQFETTLAPLRRGRWRQLLRTWVPATVVILLLAVCFLGPFILPIPKPTGGDVLETSLGPFSPGHLLGTDSNGNDILSRLIYGGRSSLFVGISVNAIGVIIGGAIGAVSAYVGGWIDTLIMRGLDILIAFPSLVLILAVAQSLGPSTRNTILALSFFTIPAVARIARSSTLRLREMPFMQAAQLCGSPTWRILLRHIAPNIGPQLLTFTALGMGIVIVTEGALSFLGLGIPPPAPSWGNMIFDGQQSLSATPLEVVWPSLALLITVLSFNQLGESLRARWSGR